MDKQTTIDFLRHGEVAGGSYYRGSTDDPLTQKGWQQMLNTVNHRHWDHIVSSPLCRCLAFAEYISKQQHSALSVIDLWQEIHFGDWEGKTADQINPSDLQQFYQNPFSYTPPGAESYTRFASRIQQAWDSLIASHQGKHILVISHAGVIRCLFNLQLQLPVNKLFNIRIDHASLTQFQHYPENFTQLTFHNFTQPDLYSPID